MLFRTCLGVSFSGLRAGRVCTVSIECLTLNDPEGLQLLRGKAEQLCISYTQKQCVFLAACCNLMLQECQSWHT